MTLTPELSDSLDSGRQPAELVESMRTMFGSPRIALEPVLRGSSADEVIANPKIAIIDDEPINIKVVHKHLSLAGYQRFVTTDDSRAAMALIADEMPDVVLLDIMMPHVSGLEILRQIRADETLEDLPVVILTAAAERETKHEALRIGATEFLTKPVDPVELEIRLRNVLVVKAHQDRVKRYAWELELEVAIRTTELAEAHREVVECMAKVGEFRDNETGNHVLRVGRFAELIAQQLGMPREFCSRIRYAATLHDIGKVGLPDAILLKPGQLDEAETRKMRQHCCYGQRVCLRLPKDESLHLPLVSSEDGPAESRVRSPIMRMAAVIAATHHERWDGFGYPQGLRGEQIPIEGRITAVADVFDAVRSHRPYKPAFTLEQSLAIIRGGSGTQFDPDVVDGFLRALPEVLEAAEQHDDGFESPPRGAFDPGAVTRPLVGELAALDVPPTPGE